MNKQLSLTPSKKETLWGLVYLALELLVLPVLLPLILDATGLELSLGRQNGLFFLLNFAAVTFIFRRFLKESFLQARGHFGRILFTALRGYLLYWAGNLAVGTLVLMIDPNFVNVNDSYITDLASGDYSIIAFCTVLLVPVTEELLFRGVLFGGLCNRSRTAAFLVSTLVFCAIHVVGYIGLYSPQTLLLCFLQYLPAGLALGWAWVRSDSFFAPVLIHMSVNALGVLFMR